ncbi:hypothetical protein LPJ70_001987 [Coemansia sp. RSA 2708]|nr:hypothetical protein LPJ70_001987 [Coemansia sp. RSA 2708]
MPQMSPEMLEQMYSNPMVQQMMEQVYSNPELMRSMIESNPMLQQQLTPQMREMLGNPEFLRMATNPDIMRAAAQFQSAMQSAQPGGGGNAGSNAGMYNPWASNSGNSGSGEAGDSMAALQGSGFIPSQRANSQEPPEQRFREQLQQLRDMGFLSPEENIQALLVTNGNVERAVELLLDNTRR